MRVGESSRHEAYGRLHIEARQLWRLDRLRNAWELSPKAGWMKVVLGLASCLLSTTACGGSSVTPNADQSSAAGAQVDGGSPIDGRVEGGSVEGGGAMTKGTLGGLPFSARGALGLFYSIYGPGIPPVVAVVMPANFSLSCDILQAEATNNSDTAFANGAELEIILKTGGPALTPTTYHVLSADADGGLAMTAAASYLKVGPTCSDPSTEVTTAGIVTISAVSNATISGTFDLTFSNGDYATGKFSAPVCVVDPFSSIQPMSRACAH